MTLARYPLGKAKARLSISTRMGRASCALNVMVDSFERKRHRGFPAGQKESPCVRSHEKGQGVDVVSSTRVLNCEGRVQAS